MRLKLGSDHSGSGGAWSSRRKSPGLYGGRLDVYLDIIPSSTSSFGIEAGVRFPMTSV